MNRLNTGKRKAIVAALVEGNSVRATARMVGAAKNTVLKLLVEIGQASSDYMDQNMRNLPCRRLECDEIWAFIGAKQRNVPESRICEPGIGDVWTWTAICADTKLVPSFMVGGRDAGAARSFMRDLASRLARRVQLTTDAHRPYLVAVDDAFGENIDYAMLQKLFGPDSNPRKPESKYSPGKVNGSRKRKIIGNPNPQLVSTSYAERNNLTMRMGMRRFTRLTNAFSKEFANHCHAIALHFMHYNYCRKHQSLGETPAQAAGIADRQWTIGDLVALLN